MIHFIPYLGGLLVHAKSAVWILAALAIAFSILWPRHGTLHESAPGVAGLMTPAQMGAGVNLPAERWDAN